LKKIEDKLPVKAENFPVLTGKFSGLQKCRVGELFFAGALMSTGAWNALNGFTPAELRKHQTGGTLLPVATILPFPMCADWLHKPHWMIILVYFSPCRANPPLILLWQYYCA
jgi:hypothetical protein